MMSLLSLELFLIGLFFGSFFLVLSDRIPQGISPFTGRSKCDSCGHTLSWLDLFPVLSFLLLRGRCRYCHKTLSWYYPFVEVVTGLLFALTPWLLLQRGDMIGPYTLIFALFTVSVCIITFFSDLKYTLIPFIIVIPASLLNIMYRVVFFPETLLQTILAGFGAALFFFAIYWLTRGKGMGFGDVVLALYLGFLLSVPGVVVALYIAFLTGAAVSLILVVTGRKKMKGGIIPFGPFLIFGGIVTFFWGTSLWTWWMTLFLR